MFSSTKYRLVLFAIILLLLTTGCTFKEDVWFYDNGEWKAQTSFEYTKVELDLNVLLKNLIPGIAQDLVDVLPFKFNLDNPTEKVLKLFRAYVGSKGVEARYNCTRLPFSNQRTCEINMRGWEYSQITDIISPEILQVRQTEQGTLSLTADFSSLNVLVAPWIEEEITVHARDFVASNASIRRSDTMTWINPERLEVELVPQKHYPWSTWMFSLPWLWNVLALIGIAILGVFVWQIVRRRSSG
ncbi:MAG: hypothetical protein D6694_14035, partial [Gammaproteobacteria bacterium]